MHRLVGYKVDDGKEVNELKDEWEQELDGAATKQTLTKCPLFSSPVGFDPQRIHDQLEPENIQLYSSFLLLLLHLLCSKTIH